MQIAHIQAFIKENIQTQTQILSDTELLERLGAAIQASVQAYQNGHKLLFCGNGGSAADAQHIAAELSGRFRKDRPALHAEALHTNSSYLTAVANDYGYEAVYARLVEGIARKGDILFTFSTSGNSANILKAAQAAQNQSVTVISFTGDTGGKLAAHSDILINIPSQNTPRIQEAHILLGHILCEGIENALF
jgi:D-sedoheptulose 7-phosphate isomerase